jgi:hypothetical protein
MGDQEPRREAQRPPSPIKEIAQARVEADAVYDAKGKQEVADSCCLGLGVAREQTRAGEQELQTQSLEAVCRGMSESRRRASTTAISGRLGGC